MNRIRRLKISIQGAVQGVGFRPFIYRLADELKLSGWVLNSARGVLIEVEGGKSKLDEFMTRIQAEKPTPAFIQSFESCWLDAVGFEGFSIRESRSTGKKSVLVLPDIATCPACLRELFDPANRRYRYPFTNCTLCGPRFSIIRSLPYDRPQTTMSGFEMCERCAAEYSDPNDRRFHAQPNACPDCGPRLSALDSAGRVLAEREQALGLAVETIRCGGVVALKGIGGYQLLVDAGNPEAVVRLRRRKKRNEKPFAVMVDTVETAGRICRISPLEERLLLSPESPIVILERKHPARGAEIVHEVAPWNPTLGIMLPYSPLHHILMRDLARPVVATSGNISDEPICIDEAEALEKLGQIGDLFLVHDRPIARYVDDSVVRLVNGQEMMIRRARGYAPLPVTMPADRSGVLALGGHQKNTVALQVGRNAFVSQHVGDLENAEAMRSFEHAIESLCSLYEAEPETVVCDLHPDYLSTRHALSSGCRVRQIQHHYAHVCSCMAENGLEGPLLGIAWDGTGYGPDHTVWGGEFLLVEKGGWRRVGHLRLFRLPGGEKAVKEPRRSPLGILYELLGDGVLDGWREWLPSAFAEKEMPVLGRMLAKGFNAPQTSSMGRLFDAVAALVNQRHVVSYEGQAAMELEFSLAGLSGDDAYAFGVGEIIDWGPVIEQIRLDLENGVDAGRISLRFHNGLSEMAVAVAKRVGLEQVAISGGCFQNRYLAERTVNRLAASGFRPYLQQRFPPNDGGLSVGQLLAAARQL